MAGAEARGVGRLGGRLGSRMDMTMAQQDSSQAVPQNSPVLQGKTPTHPGLLHQKLGEGSGEGRVHFKLGAGG